jgi:hypothetical protein
MTPSAAPSVIRAWARQQGIAVGGRGRLAPAILAAYETAHAGSAQAVVEKVRVVLDEPAAKSPDKALQIAASPSIGSPGTSQQVQARRS